MTPSFAPSLSTSALSYEHEVFVSFCGKDTHTSFTCHLLAALDRKKIRACRGEFNRTELMKAIETSRMAVVVFSESYATSDRCLDELAKIMECNRVLNQRVFPIFYDVSPSQVREQKGNFEEAANLAGFHLKANRPESEFIEEIVDNILKKLNEESFTAPSLRQNDAPGQHSSAAIPHNDASSSLDLENYSWTQTLEEVTLNVPVPTVSSSVVCEIKKNHLKVGLKGQPPIIDGELFRPVKPDDCYWSIEDQKVEPESSKLSDPDPETRQTVEKMMDNSSRYKNLLQELVKKEGFSVLAYDTNRSGEEHEAIFVSTVEIREVFKGHEATTKRQAEMNAAKIAYTSLKELDGQTYESPEFFSTSKDAERAAAKVALTSLVPDGAKEDNSSRYKNLLQELVQKEGFSLPAYDTNRSGEEREAIFVSTVEIREVFKGHEATTKRQAEMNAAKIAYTSLKERKSGQGPLIVSPAHKGKETSEISSSNLQPNVTADLQQLVGATMNLNLCTIAERQAGEDRGPDTIITCNRGSSVDASYGYAPDTLFSTPCKSENGLSSHSSTNLVMDSSLVPPAETIISSCKRIFVRPRLPNMTIPKGYTILPKSDDKWVVFSPN
ncbi:hypothetical protein ACB092_07G203200 [Castanea dentata]